jgi:predicted O-methyltransferase YrrM
MSELSYGRETARQSGLDFEAYLTQIPDLHSWDDGKTWSRGGFGPTHLRALHDLAVLSGGQQAVILETGAGNSTLSFLFARPKKLIAIAPDAALFNRVRVFCADHGINTSGLDALVERSELILPKLADSHLQVDLALIDGGHGWPTVFVDFCFIYAMLRKDGILIIDDLNLHSVKELGRLLAADDARFIIEKPIGKALAFRKLKDERFLPDWDGQPYLARLSKRYTRSPSPFELFPNRIGIFMGPVWWPMKRMVQMIGRVHGNAREFGLVHTCRWLAMRLRNKLR